MVTLLEIDDQMLALLWPLMRVSGVVLIAPIFGSAYVPIRIRALIAIVLTVVVAPFAHDVPSVGLLSIDFFLVMLREIALGFAIGFVLRLVIDAAVMGGQVLATSMGLHFATVVDPNQGGTPTLGQFYVIVASLLLVVTNTHLALVELLADSFSALPLATAEFTPDAAWLVVQFGGTMLVNGLQLALPSVAAILMVNVAFGVVSRAAPSLNLFAIGFPIAMLVGFIVSVISVQYLLPIWLQAIEAAFGTMLQLAGGA
jgi:flagellar biosynthetic protein FliR